jgi:hypothetical protein
MFAAFVIGPLGALIGLIFGVWLVMRLRGHRGFARAAGMTVAVAVGIAALVGGGIQVMYLTQDILNPNAAPLQLEFEIRLPAGATVPARLNTIAVELQTDKNTMPGGWDADEIRKEGDRTVLVGRVDIYFRTSQRLLVLKMPGEPDRIFQLALSARPRLSDDFSPWARVDFIEVPDAQPRKAGPGDDFEMRYRVPDPNKPTPYIQFELRLPAGTSLPDDFHAVYIAQRRDKWQDEGYFFNDPWQRPDGDRTVLMGGMGINAPKQHPKIVLRLPGGATRVFDLKFPQTAVPTKAFGPWQAADAIEEEGQPPRPPGADDGYEMRYQIGEPR